MESSEEPIFVGISLVAVTATFFVDRDDYEQARESLIEFLSSAPPDWALTCGLRHMVVAQDEAHDPGHVNFSPN